MKLVTTGFELSIMIVFLISLGVSTFTGAVHMNDAMDMRTGVTTKHTIGNGEQVQTTSIPDSEKPRRLYLNEFSRVGNTLERLFELSSPLKDVYEKIKTDIERQYDAVHEQVRLLREERLRLNCSQVNIPKNQKKLQTDSQVQTNSTFIKQANKYRFQTDIIRELNTKLKICETNLEFNKKRCERCDVINQLNENVTAEMFQVYNTTEALENVLKTDPLKIFNKLRAYAGS